MHNNTLHFLGRTKERTKTSRSGGGGLTIRFDVVRYRETIPSEERGISLGTVGHVQRRSHGQRSRREHAYAAAAPISNDYVGAGPRPPSLRGGTSSSPIARFYSAAVVVVFVPTVTNVRTTARVFAERSTARVVVPPASLLPGGISRRIRGK